MRKRLFCALILVFFYLSALSQFAKESEAFLYAKIDSLKKAVSNLNGKTKVDCLNAIVDQYQIMDEDNQMQIDSAGPYASQAFSTAVKIGYKRGLGYAILKRSYIKLLWGQIHKDNNQYSANYADSLNSIKKLIAEAMQIGIGLNDFTMIGSGYALLARLEGLEGNKVQQIKHLKEAISYIERPTIQPKNEYKEMNYTNCSECNGQEFRLGELYGWLGNLNKNEATESFKKAVALYKKAKAYPAVSNTYSRLINIANLNGNTDVQKEYINDAIAYFKKVGDSTQIGDFYMRLARVFGVKTNTEAAVDNFKKAVSFYHGSGNEQELSATIMVCASYWAMGDFENSLEWGKKSVQLVEEHISKKNDGNVKNDEWGKAYYWVARIYSAAGDHETAISFMKKARDHYHDKPSSLNLWTSAIGEMYRLKGDYDSSMYYLKSFDSSTDANLGMLYLGRLYISLGQYDKALPLINKMKEAEDENGNPGNLGGDYTDLAKIWLGKNDYQNALSNAQRGLSLLITTGRNQRLIDSYQTLSEIFNRLGRNDSAFFYLKQSTNLKDSLLNKQFYFRLSDYKKQAEEERKTSQINLLNKENQIKEQRLKQQATLRNSLIAGFILVLLLGVFIFRNLSLKQRNDKLRMQKDLELQHLENEKKQAELHQHAVELEMQALRAQMNPHFIFNCLSSINRFIFKNDNKTASDYLTRFSRLIRMVLMHSKKKLIPLEDELEMIRLYLDLERLRFKDAFDYSITTTNIVDAGTIFIPPLLLQPFCENAVWHGLMHKETKGHLNVIISEVVSENDKTLHCIIEDNGVGREKAALMNSKSAGKDKSLGLKITTERIALLNRENNFNTFYKIDDILNDEHEVAGTRVQVKIKFKEAVEEII